MARPAIVSLTKSLLRTAVGCGVLLMLVSSPVRSQNGVWTRERTGTMGWLHAIFFLNEERGWAVGSRGTFLATVDGGRSWQIQARPTADGLRDLYFIDEQRGWLLCEANVYELKHKEDPRTYLLRTADGGAHWQRENLPDPNADNRLLRTVFSKGGRGWTFGEAGTIFTTRDIGVTWTRVSSPSNFLLLGGTFLDDERGWLVGAGSTVMQTLDGGTTWNSARVSDGKTSVRFAAVSFVGPKLGWVVGNGGSIYRTMDGGRTWQQQGSGVDSDLFDVKFVNASEGWASGAEGTIIHTEDGGLHWNREQTGLEHPLERLFMLDRQRGWAVGFGGTILRYHQPSASIRAR